MGKLSYNPDHKEYNYGDLDNIRIVQKWVGLDNLMYMCVISLQAIENGRNLVALSCSIKLVNAIVSAEKRETPITDVRTNQLLIRRDLLIRPV